MKAIRILLSLIAFVLFTNTINAQPKENQTSSLNNALLQSDIEGVNKKIAEFATLIKKNVTVWIRKKEVENSYDLTGTGKDLKVQDDKITYNNKGEHITLFFSNFMDYQIDNWKDDQQNEGPHIDKIVIYSKEPGIGKKLYDDLIYIQNKLYEKQFVQPLKLFETVAAQYRALKVKPTISEEQRKYIVQANLFNQQKDYYKAIDLYNKVIEVDQTAYPSAYLNLALLSAQIKKYPTAIYNMKKYLLLDPEPTEARSAQDKIYEWEALSGK